MDRSVKATRTQQRGIETVGTVGCCEDQDVGGLQLGTGHRPRRWQQQVDPIDHLVLELSPSGREIEALHLHEEFIDDAGGAFTHSASAHARSGHADGVELFDETDRAPFGSRRLAKRFEELADLAVGHAEEVRLELARRHKQERHLCLGRNGFRQIGLASAGGTFEQHTATRRAAHLVGECLVVQKQVQCVDGLSSSGVGTDDVGETNVRIAGPQHGVRRLAGGEHGDQHHSGDQHQHHAQEEELRVVLNDGRHSQPDRITAQKSIPEPHHGNAQPQDQTEQTLLSLALAIGAGIDLVTTQYRPVLHLRDIHHLPTPMCRLRLCGHSTCLTESVQDVHSTW
jgi:hypothetical protein